MHGQRDGGSACVRVYVCMCVCVHVCMCVCVLICAPCRPGQVGEELSIQGDAFWGWAPLPHTTHLFEFIEVKVTAAESRA